MSTTPTRPTYSGNTAPRITLAEAEPSTPAPVTAGVGPALNVRPHWRGDDRHFQIGVVGQKAFAETWTRDAADLIVEILERHPGVVAELAKGAGR